MKVIKYPSTMNPMSVVMNYVCERNRICPFCGSEMPRTSMYNMDTQTEYIGTKEKRSHIFEDPDGRVLKMYNGIRKLFHLEPYRQYLALGFYCPSCKGEWRDEPFPVYRGTPDIDFSKFGHFRDKISMSAGSYDDVCGKCHHKDNFYKCLKQIEYKGRPVVICSQQVLSFTGGEKDENPQSAKSAI